jgi:hypothetical protein
MLTITQAKVAGLEPRWAPFAGFSLLFDNPGSAAARSPERTLYAQLDAAIGKIGRDALSRDFLLCPLPLSSYHVTVWDGINAENLSSVSDPLRAEWAAYLRGIPQPMCPEPASMKVVRDSALAHGPRMPIKFRFEDLAVWGHQALVARLLPADEASAARLAELCVAREELNAAALRSLGVCASSRYAPHVTLGYFANEAGGQRCAARLMDLNTQFQPQLADATITFLSVGVYVFPDMANFFRR